MQTNHQVYFNSATSMEKVADASIHLVLTSPPYPMIAMWDKGFCHQDRQIEKSLAAHKGLDAFEGMHRILDQVWQEVYRVLVPGGIVCINIGDATRKVGTHFVLYPNHSRIVNAMQALGFSVLPEILWRKQTNAPNKFMGSGMLPVGSYVTLEHEYILVFRKGGLRAFTTTADKELRHKSAYFWEERNQWFSDIWVDLKGTTQKLTKNSVRARSGAFPFELPYRLINMFSVQNDLVLDPFMGIGTTAQAAAVAGRNSLGFEIEKMFIDDIKNSLQQAVIISNDRINKRVSDHLAFVADRLTRKKVLKYTNRHYGFPVITRQETGIMFPLLDKIDNTGAARFRCDYRFSAKNEFCATFEQVTSKSTPQKPFSQPEKPFTKPKKRKAVQESLF